MKKTLSLLLSILMIFSAAAVGVSAAEDDGLKLTVANDLHLDLVSCTQDTVEKTNTISEDYPHASNGGQLHYESEAIIDSFLASAAQGDSEYVLLVGDLTHHGTADEHAAFAQKLSDFEKSSGKKILVVPGNHDYRGTTVEQFKQYYAQFGYNDAQTVHESNGSYVIQLNDEYTLLAIDSCDPGVDSHGMTQELKGWIKQQGEKAKAEGKKVIAMLHHNFIEHIFLGATVYNGSVIKEKEYGIAQLFSELGIKYTFTGHTHQQDIADYKAEDGTVIYSIVTASINSYPCPYRNVSFGDEVKIETEHVDKIDVSKLPGGITPAALKTAETDFMQYARNCTYTGLKYRLYACTTPDGIIQLLGIEDEEVKAVISKVGTRLEKILNTPIYEKDALTEGDSLETLAKMYKTTLPETEFGTILDLLTYFYQSQSEGDEYNPSYANETILLTRTVAVALNYTLAEVSDTEYAIVMAYAFEALGAKIPVDLLKYAGSAIKRFEGCEIFVTTAVIPLISEFGTDDSPADNDVTLPGYSQLVEGEQGVLEVLMNIIKKIVEIVKTLLALVPNA